MEGADTNYIMDSVVFSGVDTVNIPVFMLFWEDRTTLSTEHNVCRDPYPLCRSRVHTSSFVVTAVLYSTYAHFISLFSFLYIPRRSRISVRSMLIWEVTIDCFLLKNTAVVRRRVTLYISSCHPSNPKSVRFMVNGHPSIWLKQTIRRFHDTYMVNHRWSPFQAYRLPKCFLVTGRNFPFIDASICIF